MAIKNFSVRGMSCAACSSRVEKAVSGLEGVKTCSVNLLTNSMQVDFDSKALSTDDILLAVKNSGYEASIKGSHQETKKTKHNPTEKTEEKDFAFRLKVSLVFAIPLFLIAMLPMFNIYRFPVLNESRPLIFSFTQFLLLLPVLVVNKKIFSSGFKALFSRAPNMNSLIAIGSTASVLYGLIGMFKIFAAYELGETHGLHHLVHNLYFESASMILTFVCLGKFLEAKAKGKTSEAVNKLLNLVAHTATVIRNGEFLELPVDDIVVNDIVFLRPGESIAVDGIVVEGLSDIDTSCITGESQPRFAEVGSALISGSINLTGSLKMRATKVGRDTTLSQIIQMVEKATTSKPKIAKLADKISLYFVPIIILIAITTFVVELVLGVSFGEAFSNGVSVLVVACPCALGLATPTAVMVSVGRAANLGILIKDSSAIENASRIGALVFDKTGTLTTGRFELERCQVVAEALDEKTLLQIAGSLELHSEHPIAKALVKKMGNYDLPALEFESFSLLPGMGVSGSLKTIPEKLSSSLPTSESKFFVGNERLANHIGIKLPAHLDEENKLFLMTRNALLGIFYTSDTLKTSSAEAIDKIKNLKIKSYMFTGDSEKIAQKFSDRLQLDGFKAELLPKEKLERLKDLRATSSVVGFVGDGINDSPALAAADVGIAIGTGTDIAIESADAVLISENLLRLVDFLRLSKYTMRTIKQNLFWALFYNALCVPIAAGVLRPFGISLNPSFAAFAMSLSSITVTLNALRLRFFQGTTICKTEKKNLNLTR